MSVVDNGGIRPRLNSIQVLRALAALMVTVAHAAEEAMHFFGLQLIFETSPLGKGVDLFFIISGFIIYYSSREQFSSRAGIISFIYNRFSRVIPLYFLFTTLMILVLVIFPAGVKEARLDIWQIVTSYTFIPYERHDGQIAPVLSLGWTLNYEMFFYVLFAFMMWLPARRGAVAAISLLVLLAIIGIFVPADAPAPLRAWTSSIILEFAMGVALALAYERHGKTYAKNGWPALALVCSGLVALYFLNLPGRLDWLPRFVAAGVPMASTVAAAVLLLPASLAQRAPKWGIALGDSSYSLYLSHRFVQRPMQIFLTRLTLEPTFSAWLYMLLAVSVVVVVGHLVFVLIERPLLRRLRRAKSQGSLAPVDSSIELKGAKHG